MSMPRIAVTGPNGFVGREIMACCPEAIPLPGLRGSQEEIRQRIMDAEADVIIHTAAISSIPACERDPEASYRANVMLPLWIAEAAPQAKLVFFSSDQVYSASSLPGPYTEDQTAPGNVYARHKLEMEQRVLDLRPDAVLLRATWMFDMEWGMIANLLRHEGDTITVPHQHRGVTWVHEAALNALEAVHLPGGAYNFGSQTALDFPDLTALALKLLGIRKNVVSVGEQHPLWMDQEKSALLRFSSCEEGLRKCIERG